ncbi:aminotransferase class I/II-fold pyridoxal phosphate-dependent enzyme [candidate division WOR-3 bacterium]|nr:aminotransferase class I/II-fold pyridoxal phosphate-dependent enzyme [candidate division WOR-3 bacterium]
MKSIDLRSDTVTKPTVKMLDAIMNAEFGDDVLGEDPTVNELEKKSAKILGKEAALLVPSGTFGNQLALFTHCDRGDEVVLSEDSHIVVHEAGASSFIGAVQLRTVKTRKGCLTREEIDKRIRKEKDIHFPKTGLICLENALSSGYVQTLEEMKEIRKLSNKWCIPIHLDGARIFNAAIALGVKPLEIAEYCDSIMFCLSKGLCCPVGSLLVGSEQFIEKARKGRKIMGGGMRQAGIIAAPGIVALEEMTERLGEDHEKAKMFAQALSGYKQSLVEMENVKINMVFARFESDESALSFIAELRNKNILVYPPEDASVRFVFHREISEEDMDYVLSCLPAVFEKVKGK